MKYKLDIKRDVDPDGDCGFILNTPRWFRMYDDYVHVRGFDTMQELKEWVKMGGVIPCDCDDCKNNV
jgi:hypothetical protein